MSNEQLTAYLKDESYLYTLGYEELKTLVVQYPYAANLRILLLKKAHLEQNKDYDRNLQMAAAYSTNRRFLYKLVKKLKALQAMPENVILSEDYLELTELSNIEKILPAWQPAEAHAVNENGKTLSADFRLNFESPSQTPQDDEALFDLTPASNEKHDFDFMTEEEVDLLVEDIVSKFKMPEETVTTTERQEVLQELLSQKETSLEDFQAIYYTNGVEKPENIEAIIEIEEGNNGSEKHEITEGGINGIEKSVEIPNTKNNTLIFDPTEDPEWALNAQEDTLIDDEISKLEVFNHPLQLDEKTVIDLPQISPSFENTIVEMPEIVSTIENMDIIHEVEIPKVVSTVENTDIPQTLEMPEIVSIIENNDIISIVEIPESISHAENIEDFKPTETFFTEIVVNENVSSEMQDLYYTSSLPLLMDEEPSKPTIEFIEDISDKIPESNSEPEPSTFIEDLKEEEPKINGKPNYITVEDFTKINNLAFLPTTLNNHKDIVKNINEITPNITIVSRKTTTVRSIEDLIEHDKNNLPVSDEKQHITHLEDLLHAEPPNVQNVPTPETPLNGTIEDFIETQDTENTEIAESRTEAPLYQTIEDFTNTSSQDDTVFMEQLATDDSDIFIKKKDNDRPLIEFEITNQSKITLVESTLPPSVSENMTSFAEWLQQFQKPKPVEFSENGNEIPQETDQTKEIIIETVTDITNNPINEPVIEAALDNFASSNKSLKQRKYQLDNLTDIFEGSKVLPDNLFFGLSSTDTIQTTSQPYEAEATVTKTASPSYNENASVLDDILNENYNGTDDKDIEWLKIPIENITKEAGNEAEMTTDAEENSETNQEVAPPKKKKKKIMHELAARSLEMDSEIISEPLADIYAAQGLKNEAIEMYQRLSLHIPEKSDFFAAKIEKLRNSN